MQELIGHISEDTAYLVADYPYGFRLRTQIRYWIETKASRGQRLVTQTRNPKRDGAPWNAPKASTYVALRALYLAANGHVEHAALPDWPEEPAIEAFVAQYPQTCALERNARELEMMRARARAMRRMDWTIRSVREGGEPATWGQYGVVLQRLIAEELAAIRAGREVTR